VRKREVRSTSQPGKRHTTSPTARVAGRPTSPATGNTPAERTSCGRSGSIASIGQGWHSHRARSVTSSRERGPHRRFAEFPVPIVDRQSSGSSPEPVHEHPRCIVYTPTQSGDSGGVYSRSIEGSQHDQFGSCQLAARSRRCRYWGGTWTQPTRSPASVHQQRGHSAQPRSRRVVIDTPIRSVAVVPCGEGTGVFSPRTQGRADSRPGQSVTVARMECPSTRRSVWPVDSTPLPIASLVPSVST
jgi:hypothetical protein